MADVKISALPAATTPLAGTELVPIVQSGVTSSVSVDNLTAGKAVAASTMVVSANSASTALRVTQTGAGNALLVEDSANPDATPFVVTANGNVGVGTPTPSYLFHVIGRVTTQTPVSDWAFLNETSTSAARGGLWVTSGGDFGVAGTAVNSGWFASASHAYAMTSFVERMRVTTVGNVGIGTSTPVNRLQVNGSFGRGAPVTKTGNFTLANTENWIICNGSGSITVTFPAASLWTGRELTIKTIAAQTVVSASSDVVPINSASAGTAILAATAGEWATLVSDGTNWVIMARGA